MLLLYTSAVTLISGLEASEVLGRLLDHRSALAAHSGHPAGAAAETFIDKLPIVC